MTAALAMERTRRLQLAIGSGALARLAGAAVQLFSLPYAAATLGNQGFVIYGLAMAILGWMNLSQFGVGPAMALDISAALGREDEDDVASLFRTGTALTAAATLIVVLVAMLLFTLAPRFLAPHDATADGVGDFLRCVVAVIAIFTVANLLTTVENAQNAFQERHQLNIATFWGSFAAALTIVAVARFAPHPASVLLAAQVPLLFARVWNARRFLASHPVWARGRAQLNLVPRLLRRGGGIAIAGSLTNFLSHLYPTLVIGSRAPAADAAVILALMNMVVILASFFALSAAPLMGAVPEASARGDRGWVRRHWAKTVAVNLAFAGAIILVLALTGRSLFLVWYHGTVTPTPAAMIFAALYLAALGVETVTYATLNGLSELKLASTLMSLRAILFALLLAFWPPASEPSTLFALLAGISWAVSVIPLSARCWAIVR